MAKREKCREKKVKQWTPKTMLRTVQLMGLKVKKEEERDSWMPMVEEAMQKYKIAFEEIKMNLIHTDLD